MIDLVPYRAWHLRALIVQPRQAATLGEVLALRPTYPAALETPHSRTAMLAGVPIGCGGVAPLERHRGYAWGSFSLAIPKPSWLLVVRCIQHELRAAARSGLTRIETHCDVDWDESTRLCQMLGFKAEGIARGWYPDGRPAIAWALAVNADQWEAT